jgi:hypothetical protein
MARMLAARVVNRSLSVETMGVVAFNVGSSGQLLGCTLGTHKLQCDNMHRSIGHIIHYDVKPGPDKTLWKATAAVVLPPDTPGINRVHSISGIPNHFANQARGNHVFCAAREWMDNR